MAGRVVVHQQVRDGAGRRPQVLAAALAGAVTVQATSPVTGAWAAVRYAARPWGFDIISGGKTLVTVPA